MCYRCYSDNLQKDIGIWCLNGCTLKWESLRVCTNKHSRSESQNYCSVHWVNKQTIQRTEVRIQLYKSHWYTILKLSWTVMNDNIKMNSQGYKDILLSQIGISHLGKSISCFLDHFMVILNKTTLTSWQTVHWLIICKLFNTIQIRNKVKLNVISHHLCLIFVIHSIVCLIILYC